MADFEEVRRRLSEARESARRAGDEAFAARERLRRVEQRQAA